ncbi:MAG: 4-(cytidine 5'-diphospho)-2-C-methyl-D-erythritol kinase [Clostridia bacterium]|nr:4-(cytidine 5'-diphospho)-2-C-methyl-D-erythritol kinase [Clostridia bacterium]
MRISLKAHAKINWSLNILALRPDGYHELDMLMQSLELHDELIFEDARWLSLTVGGQALPVGGRNLIIKAANALNEYTGERHGARIQLKKHIPVRAGLGGGSADCAMALVALNQLWKLYLPFDKLLEIGAKLGADVPFCMLGGLAQVGGVGEKLAPIPGAPSIPLAMVTPGGGLSTPAVFKAWDEGGYPIVQKDMRSLADALIAGDMPLAQSLSHNSLEAPAISLMPEIGEISEKFRAMGANFVRMTGSGSTVFAAFDTDEQAKAAAKQIPGAIATRTKGE